MTLSEALATMWQQWMLDLSRTSLEGAVLALAVLLYALVSAYSLWRAWRTLQ